MLRAAFLGPSGPARPLLAAETRGAPRWPPAALFQAREAAAEGEALSRRRVAMEASAQEELSALAAIFCGPGEWEVLSRSGDCCAPRGRGSRSSAPPRPRSLPRAHTRGPAPGWGGVVWGAGGSVRRPPQCAPARASAVNREPDARAWAPPPAGPCLLRRFAPLPTSPFPLRARRAPSPACQPCRLRECAPLRIPWRSRTCSSALTLKRGLS